MHNATESVAEHDYDVVIVGAGAAGLAAAIEASEAGATVLLIEGSDTVGGASRLSSGVIMGAGTRFQQALGIEDSPEALYDFYMTVNQWNVTPGAAWRLCHEAGPAIEWVADLGVEFFPAVLSGSDEPVNRGHPVVGNGQSLVDGLYGAVRHGGKVDIALGNRIDRILVDAGAVVGVANGGDQVRAAATIVATGGFGANFALLAKYAPWALGGGDWSYYVGPETSRGDMIKFAQQINAPLVGHNRVAVTPRPDFGREAEGEFPGWLVFVDGNGRRFCNEMAPYAVQQHQFLDAEGPYWAVLDDAIKRASTLREVQGAKKIFRPGERAGDWVSETIDHFIGEGAVIAADTLVDLAYKMGVPVENFTGAIDFYNEDVRAGEDTLFRKRADTLQPICEPPFYATQIRLRQVAATFIGPRIDADGRVLGTDQRPIAGLFAAGECVGGVLGHRYVGSGNSLANSLSFGRVTGQKAAARARSLKIATARR
ncbi:flavocytochrome c [Mycobacterium avium subsp. hominissuis]